MGKLITTLTALAFSTLLAPAQTLTDYQTTVNSQNPNYYFTFDNGSLASSGTNPNVITWASAPDPFSQFAYDVFGNTNDTIFFATKNDLLVDQNEGSDLIINSGAGGAATTDSTATGSISFLFKSLGAGVYTAQKYIFDGGHTSANHNEFSLLFQNTNTDLGDFTNALTLRFGNNDNYILPFANVIPDTWYYFAFTYTEATNGAYLDSTGTNLVVNKGKWYLGIPGGSLASGETTNALDAVAGEGVLYLGNSTATTAGFAAPGSGNLDEFATWARRLSDTEVQAQFANLPLVVTATNVIVDDTFADANRTNTGPLQADWWSSSSTSGNSVECYTNQLGLISGTSGRGLHGTFAPQTLAVGDTMRVTYTFTTPATVGTGKSTALKVALMDLNNPGLAADQDSSSSASNPLYVGQPGYMSDFDVNTGATADTSIRKHDVTSTLGRFLGTTGEWIDSTSSADAGYAFAPNTEYDGVFSVTRTGSDSMDIFSSMSQGGGLMDSWSASDTSDIANHFGMFGVWVNSSTFGNTTTPGELEDNGITFSEIKVEIITTSAVTPPGPTLSISVSGGNVILSWPSSTDAGYSLQSSPSLSSPAWSGAGTAVIVGSEYVVTNALTPNAQFYRLEK